MDFNIIYNDQPSTMAELCARHSVPYVKGTCYYLLQKKENVSSSKELFAYHEKGEYISNASNIRSKFGLSGANIGPGDIPVGWELYIQSTSPNRKLPGGTKALIRGNTMPLPSGSVVTGSTSATSSLPVQTSSTSSLSSSCPIQNSQTSDINKKNVSAKLKTTSDSVDEPKKRKAEEVSTSTVSKVSKVNVSSNSGWFDVGGSMSIKQYGDVQHSSVIAGFDMDWTLIRTKSGKTFAENANDWELWCPSVPARLQQAHQRGEKVIVFTNQGGIAKGNETLSNVHQKLDAIQAVLDVPMLAVILMQNDLNRKPRIGAWQYLEQNLNGGIQVNRSQSIYVGDGAGRLPPYVKKKDFGPGDLYFALNLGSKFKTPEQYFQDVTDGGFPTNFEFDPRSLGAHPTPLPSDVTTQAGPVEIVVCIGSPGSGKSNLSKKALPSHIHINQDKLKTKQKCWKLCEESIVKGQSVVIDNQNRSISDREAYVQLSKKYKIPIRAIRINMPKELCFHLNEYRALNVNSDENRGDQRVPKMVIHGFYKNVQEPTLKEGFTTVSTLGLEHLELQGSEKDKALIKSFLI